MINDNLNKIEISSLSEKDKATFLMCLGCEWLGKIDYENLRVYCSKPKCEKRGEKNG